MAVSLILLCDAQHSLEYSCILMQKTFLPESLMEKKLNRQRNILRGKATLEIFFFFFTVTATLFSKIISQYSITSPALVFGTVKCCHTLQAFLITVFIQLCCQENYTSLWITISGEPHSSMNPNCRKTTLLSGSQF